MKRYFQIIGLITFLSFSFFYTEKTLDIVKNTDTLMNEIKQNASDFFIEPQNAIIKDNYIIPGINGREVDIDKSYDVIKKVGKYSPNLLIFKEIKPQISIQNNYDKFIIKSNKEHQVTLVFKLKDNIDDIITILNNNNVKSSFFIEYNYFKNNKDKIIKLINNNYTIGIISNDYKDVKFNWIKNQIYNTKKQSHIYCYTEIDNINILNKCSKNKSYTIKPNIIIKNNPFIKIKNNLKNGSIISLETNSKLKEELPLIIKYLKNKGYNISNLEEFIKE